MKKKFLLLVLINITVLFPQQIAENEYGVRVVDNIYLYESLTAADSTKLFIDLKDFIPGIITEVRYASDNNFYGSAVYDEDAVFLRRPAAEALFKVQLELLAQNKTLKIFDAYRPYIVTVLFYEKIKDTNFVASAYTGSRHNRGCAVDLTIADLLTGDELRMPTEYDDFSERAAVDYMNIPDEEKANRNLLQDVMKKYGFLSLRSEWWHFDFPGWKKYEITDISFNELRKIYLEYLEVKEYAR